MKNLLGKEMERYEAKINEKMIKKEESEGFTTILYKNKKTEVGRKITILKYSKKFDYLMVAVHYPDDLPHKAYTVAVELITDDKRELIAQY